MGSNPVPLDPCECSEARGWRHASALFGVLLSLVLVGSARGDEGAVEDVIRTNRPGRVVSTVGQVEYLKAGQPPAPARADDGLEAGDGLHTLELSRATVRLRGGPSGSSRTLLYLKDLTRLLIVAAPPAPPLAQQPGDRTPAKTRPAETSASTIDLRLENGQVYFLNHSSEPAPRIHTPGAEVAPKGTEFLLAVDPLAKQTALTMFDGDAELSNGTETRVVPAGFQGLATPGQPIELRPLLKATNLVQWWTYYPGVVDPDELDLDAAARARLAPSLEAYRRGNLRRALEALPAYPPSAGPPPGAEAVYFAAVRLGAGDVSGAERALASTGDAVPLARALRTVMRAVAHAWIEAPSAPVLPAPATRTASERLALSYLQQAGHDLDAALRSAREAVARSPGFGFGWARVAELEFSLGFTRRAGEAAVRARDLSPENAQATALEGFLAAAENRVPAALERFEAAIERDPLLANAWLGRGLCRIRQGNLADGLEDLGTATVLEPGRALLRSYAGKGLGDAGAARFASDELELAKRLDPFDPTPWLYEALLDLESNRVNDAVAALDHSTELNDNRRVYRSRLLLDADRAVRGANLASVYADAGLIDTSVREATRAVNADYANASAHLFLANSYNALRDPRQISLRYETPWLAEFLLANLLAPVGAGTLSQTVSQHEYAKLFERDGVGVVNQTTWTSNGDWLESAAQYGQFGNFEYALDALYRSEVGQGPNADFEQLTASATLKYQVTATDHAWLQVLGYGAESGDVLPRYDPANTDPGLRFEEQQEPFALAGWHREWQPGVRTLLLVSPWNNRLAVTHPENTSIYFMRDRTGAIAAFNAAVPTPLLEYESRYTGLSAELEQLWQTGPQTLIAGVRYQQGAFDTRATLDVSAFHRGSSDSPTTAVEEYAVAPDFGRLALYAYDLWRPWQPLLVTVGLGYDWLEQPVNFRTLPTSDLERSSDLVTPKAGLTFTPWRKTTLRGAYSRNLGGVSFDQSLRLEPVQVAGFNQVWRGLVPEAVTGSVAGQELETWGVALDQDFGTRTYLTLAAEQRSSDAVRDLGAFEFVSGGGAAGTPGVRETTLRQELDFRERALTASASQLVGRDLAFTARYRLSEAGLDWALPEVPARARGSRFNGESDLHELELAARFNHPSGAFAAWASSWTRQANRGDVAGLPGDDFWQHNLWVGWRLFRRQVEVAFGVLNLTGQDYRLVPLNYYLETYRDRTFAVSGRFRF